MRACEPVNHMACRPLVPMQVIELAAAVHRLNQDKCQLENQMEMEEVPPLCKHHAVMTFSARRRSPYGVLYTAHCLPHRKHNTVDLLCRRRWSTGCSANLKDFLTTTIYWSR